MPLPDKFSPAEHLQDVIRLTQNRIVRDEFNDLGDDSWESDISTPRGSLRVACTHLDADSFDITLGRLWLFFGVLRKCVDFHPAIFGEPSKLFQESNKYYPQIQLHFLEKYQEVEEGYEQLRAQISFRLMNETSTSITTAELTTIANKIKTLFYTTRFSWKKGRELYTYTDQKKGYYFQLYTFSKADAKKVIEQVLDIQGHSPEWGKMNGHTNEEPASSYPIVPPVKTILGKPYREPRERPAGTVHFAYALAHIHGRPRPLVILDPDNRYRDALVR